MLEAARVRLEQIVRLDGRAKLDADDGRSRPTRLSDAAADGAPAAAEASGSSETGGSTFRFTAPAAKPPCPLRKESTPAKYERGAPRGRGAAKY